MSAKHSPGPFKASKGDEDDPNRWLVLADGPVPYLIATIENGQPGDTLVTEGHTAQLFAAAPKMLQALKDWKQFREGVGFAVEGRADEIEAAMEAAIAMAEAEPTDEEDDTALHIPDVGGEG